MSLKGCRNDWPTLKKKKKKSQNTDEQYVLSPKYRNLLRLSTDNYCQNEAVTMEGLSKSTPNLEQIRISARLTQSSSLRRSLKSRQIKSS